MSYLSEARSNIMPHHPPCYPLLLMPLQLALLRDAMKQLDQPFLLAVVGEFNSGKSSVINSLLVGAFTVHHASTLQ